jgi:hypothetical protein
MLVCACVRGSEICFLWHHRSLAGHNGSSGSDFSIKQIGSIFFAKCNIRRRVWRRFVEAGLGFPLAFDQKVKG